MKFQFNQRICCFHYLISHLKCCHLRWSACCI